MENSAESESSRPSASLLRTTPPYTNSHKQQLNTARARVFAQREVIILQKLVRMEKQSLNGVNDSNLFEQMTLNCATASHAVLETYHIICHHYLLPIFTFALFVVMFKGCGLWSETILLGLSNGPKAKYRVIASECQDIIFTSLNEILSFS